MPNAATMEKIRAGQAENRKARQAASRGGGRTVRLSAEAYARVFGHATRARTGRYVMRDGHLVALAEAELATTRARDSKHIESQATACCMGQVDDFNRTFGHLGVTYKPDGTAVYDDRAAKKRVFQARGLVDHDEVWSGRNV